MHTDRPFWIAFSVFPGIGPVRFRLLYDYFGTAQNAWKATVSDLRNLHIGESLITRFDDFRRNFSIHGYMQALHEKGVAVLILNDANYPSLLKSVPDAPYVLYVKGKKSRESWDISRSVAIVGTRKMSDYGREVTRQITEGLVRAGVTVVSGLAYGIDAVAHRTSLDAGGRTIAVLGCGIDIIAPVSNTGLYHQITEGGGAIVSEMPLGLRPSKGLFPARNRIISGLSLGVVVTEGGTDSGALITARYAAEQGRDVFAVPGPITSITSKGPSTLLKNGAKLVENVDDILNELGVTPIPLTLDRQLHTGATPEEKKIVQELTNGPVSIHDLIMSLHLPVATISTAITMLEVRGIVYDMGNKMYALTK